MSAPKLLSLLMLASLSCGPANLSSGETTPTPVTATGFTPEPAAVPAA